MAASLLAIVGPTATGKSALAIRLAERLRGEIVSCDSTAVYRGLDIGTDKPSAADRARVPHHLIDVVDPDDVYSAARFAADASAAIHDIVARGGTPILAGGTGFYFRALVRGLFPGPARNDALRARLDRVAERRGVGALYRWVNRVDPESARRIQPRDQKRLVRALEVYLTTGQALTAHFARTATPLGDLPIRAVGLEIPRDLLRERVTRRVDDQFARGVVAEVTRLLDAGLSRRAHALSGLVYRQILEMLTGVRNETATRALIVQENMRYARRQVMWFRKEPAVRWVDAAADPESLFARVCEALEVA